MSKSRALYYPWIEVRDVRWLNNALLFWDQIHTIVPEGLKGPYHSYEAQELVERGFLSPLLVSSESQAVKWAGDRLLSFLSNPSWRTALLSSKLNSYIEAPPWEYIHGQKLSVKLRDELLSEAFYTRPHETEFLTRPWLQVDTHLAALYISILASRIADTAGFALATDEPIIAPFVDSLRLGWPVTKEVEVPSARLPLNTSDFFHATAQNVQAYLATCVLDSITVARWTPIDHVIRFREQYQTELDRFRAAIGELGEDLQGDYPTAEAFEQAIHDTYVNKIRPAVSELSDARKSMRMAAGPDIIKAVAFASAPALVAQLSLGPVGRTIALISGGAVSLTAVAIKYRADRKLLLSRNPYSFVLAARDHFGTSP